MKSIPVLFASALMASGLAMLPVPALAESADTIYMPNVEKGELEFEYRWGRSNFDGSPDGRAAIYEIAYGVSSRWKTELLVETEAQTGQSDKPEAWEWENVLALTEQGQYWADVGLFVEYARTFSAEPDELKVGPLLQKEIGPTVANLNLFLEREVGRDASDKTDVVYGWQVRWRGNPALEWGLQGFGELGALGSLGEDVENKLGPALFGTRKLASGNKIAYEAAVLFGTTRDTADNTLRVQLEYEM